MDIPVVIFLYKKTHTTRILFDVIRQLKPSTLYLFANGPQNESETKACMETRAIVEHIDWDCKLFKDFLDTNIGLSNRIISGLDIVFNREKAAIILEDDCIPDLSFFPFCKELLEKYSDDERVMHISGTNIIENVNDSSEAKDYYFSRYAFPCWGWATWSRSWKLFNRNFDTWSNYKKLLFINFQQKNFHIWTNLFDKMQTEKDFWDVEWMLDVWKNKGLSIVSSQNLISNIGFDQSATYTFDEKNELSNLIRTKIQFPLKHPDSIMLSRNEHLYEDKLCAFFMHAGD